MSTPLVSVVIPTFNSEKTIGMCLRSVGEQTYSNLEVIVADSCSTDKTMEIAEDFRVKVITTKDKLLGARYMGLKRSRGEYVLLLDSDQILEKTAIARAFEMSMECDLLCLEERSYQPKTWTQRLIEADRHLVHDFAWLNLDPSEGVLMARFYKKNVLEIAFDAMPKEIMSKVVAHDHAIIYYEAHKVSQKVGIVPNAVWHIEPSGLIELWKKNYRYGKTTRALVRSGSYRDLLRRKTRFRRGVLSAKNLKYQTSSFILLALKGIAYQVGYLSE